MAQQRRRSGTYTVSERVDVYVDVDEVLGEAMRKECEARGWSLHTSESFTGPDSREIWRDFASEMRCAAAGGDLRHLDVLLLRMLTMAGIPPLVIPKKVAA